MKHAKTLGLLIVLVLALLTAVFTPFANLSQNGHHILAVIFVTLGLWIFRDPNLPYLAGGAILLGGSLACGLPLNVVATGYVSAAVWVLIPALFFGFALAKTGLGKRIAYFVLKTFEPSYFSVIISWFIIGTILSALTPSITVRLSIVMPIAINLAEACKLPDRSRGCALICFVAWGSALLPGTGWLTGSLWGLFMMGFYPAEIKPLVTFGSWFEYMAVPWFLVTIFFFALSYLFLKPKEPLNLSRDAFQKAYEALGKISKQELVTGIVLILALIMFTTEKWHHISTPAVALLAFFCLVIFRVISFQEISTGVNWDIINFFGVAIGLTAIFVNAGITNWARPFIEPSILAYAGSPLLFLILLTIGFWVIRFIDVPWGFSTIALTAPLFIPLFHDYGLHPALVSVAVIAAGNSFFLSYQQPFIMMGDAMSKSRAWSPGQVSVAGTIYAVSVISSILISSVYWKAMGLMP